MLTVRLFCKVLLSKVSYFSLSDNGCKLLNKGWLQNRYRFSSASSILRRLQSFGLQKEDIYEHPKLFFIPKKELIDKTNLLDGKIDGTDNILCLLLLPIKDIEKYLEIRLNKEKINELCSALKCSESEACYLFVKYKFLLRSKISTIKEKVDIMLDGGVSMEDIKRDSWVLTYTKEFIISRLKIARELHIDPIRPWMLRCKENVLYRASSNKEENLLAMAPHSSMEEYLCSRLDLSPSQFERLATKYPPAVRVQVSKLKELIDFLIYEGFTPNQICQTPRILCHSVHTIKDRLSTLRENHHNPQSLSILCKNKKNFDSFVFKLKQKTTWDLDSQKN